jgi:hypothetical protein
MDKRKEAKNEGVKEGREGFPERKTKKIFVSTFHNFHPFHP